MDWQQYVNIDGGGYAQWYDPARAIAWFQKAKQSASVDQTALNGRGWSAQVTAVMAAWNALSNGFRCLTVPALYYPGYRDTVAAFNASKRALREGALRRVDEHGVLAPMAPRIALDENSRVQALCVDSADGRSGPGCGGECVQVGPDVAHSAFERGCDPYTWNSMTWETQDDLVYTIVPLRWSLDLAGQIADRALAGGPLVVIQQTRTFTDVHNLAEAARLGLDLPSQLRDLAARLPRDLDNARWESGPMQDWGHTIAGFGALAAAANPLVGAAVSLFGAVISALPNAVGADPMQAAVDVAGRSAWWKPTLATSVDNPPAGRDIDIPWPDGIAPPNAPLPVLLNPSQIVAEGNARDAEALRQAGGCAMWTRLSVSKKAAVLERLGYSPLALSDVIARLDAQCSTYTPPGNAEKDALDAGGGNPPPPPPPPPPPSDGPSGAAVAAGVAAAVALVALWRSRTAPPA